MHNSINERSRIQPNEYDTRNSGGELDMKIRKLKEEIGIHIKQIESLKGRLAEYGMELKDTKIGRAHV